MVDGAIEELTKFSRLASLAKRPHRLGDERLAGHVVALEDARVLRIGAANLIYPEVKAFLRHLGGDHERAAGINPAKDRVVERVRNAANAKGLEDDCVIVFAEELEDVGVYLGR